MVSSRWCCAQICSLVHYNCVTLQKCFALMAVFSLTPLPQIRSDGRVLRADQGLLLRSLQLSDTGSYQCTSTEKNFKHTLVKLQLVVLSARTVNSIQTETPGPAPSGPLQTSAWTPSAEQYKDLLTILSQPEMGLINQYCQDYWQQGDDPAAGLHRKKDSKELKELRKPRNRRHHEHQRDTAET